MQFRSKYESIDSCYSNPGSEVEPVFDWVTDKKTGERELKIVGEKDLNSEIQSHRESCDLAIILNNIQNGLVDSSVLVRNPGFYADTVGMPTTYADLFDKAEKCEAVFENLPLDVKKAFDNDYYKFWSSLDNGTYEEVMRGINNSDINNIDFSAKEESKTVGAALESVVESTEKVGVDNEA